MKKRCKIIVLPTKEKIHDIYAVGDLEYHIDKKLSIDGIQQHLYLISDDEIREGETVYDEYLNKLVVLTPELYSIKHTKLYHKVLASTDSEILNCSECKKNIGVKTEYTCYCEFSEVKTFSEEFINSYVEAGGIDEVWVEFEKLQITWSPDTWSEHLKLRDDNTVIIYVGGCDPIKEAEKYPKIIVTMEGGILQEVIHNVEGLDVVVLDGDIEMTDDPEDHIKFEDKTYFRYAGDVNEFDPKRVKNLKE